MPSSRGSSNPGVEPESLMSPALAGGFFTPRKPQSGLRNPLLPNRDRTETERVMGEGNDRGEEGDGERGLDFSEPSRSSSGSRMTQFCLWD